MNKLLRISVTISETVISVLSLMLLIPNYGMNFRIWLLSKGIFLK